MAAETAFSIRDELPRGLRGKWMAGHAGRLLHTQAMDLPVLVAPQACVPIRSEGVDATCMAVHAGYILHLHVASVTSGLGYRYCALQVRLIPMAACAGLPRCYVPVRFRGLPVRGENELDQ